jgi:uncharacterized protein (DUF362 family)
MMKSRFKGEFAMSKLSRRDFLRVAAFGVGAVTLNKFLAACNPGSANSTSQPASTLPAATREASKDVPATAVEADSTQAASSPGPTSAPGMPDLVVVRGGEPEAMVRRALASLGGMERFVRKGANVIVKPNICVAYHTFEYAATTNPWVVAALVKMCLEAGASSVKVMDFPFGGSAQEAYVKSGIKEQVEAAGGEMAYMPGFKYVTTSIPNGVELKSTDVFDDILKADVLINVPIAKHHSSARLTLGMKNLMGVVRNRSALHLNLGQRIADLSTLLRPQLTVVDAVRILTANGPSGGNLNDVQKLDTILASTDIVTVDSYATTLFGMQPDEIPYIKAAAAMRLGRNDLENLKIEELSAGA